MTTAEKQKVFETSVRFNFLGHWYIGFEGRKCSQMHSDDKKRTMEECAWVWDTRKKKWLKKPEAV